LMIAATFLAAYAIVRALAGSFWNREHAIVLALGLTALDLAGLPAIGENIYWYTSAMTYQLSAILILLQVATAVPLLNATANVSVPRTVTAVVLLAAACGMNEVAMLLIGAFYAVIAFVAFLEHRRRPMRVAILMIGMVVICGLAVALAPGNAVRSAMYPVHHDIGRSALFTILQTVRFAADWATSGSLLLATLLMLPLAAALPVGATPLTSISRRGAVVAVIGAVATIPIVVFPPYWATGILGQHRTVGVAYVLFLVLWFVAVTACIASGWLPTPSGWIVDRRVRITAGVLLVASLALTQNGYRVAVDLVSGRPAALDREMSERYLTLERCARSMPQPAVCTVPPIVARPETLFVLDVSSDPSDWVNAAYASYFGVSRVAAAPPGERR
jgi:hypothetical protein